MASVLELMEHGFPSRTPFADLHGMYKDYLPKELKQLAPKTFCEVGKTLKRNIVLIIKLFSMFPGYVAQFETSR